MKSLIYGFIIMLFTSCIKGKNEQIIVDTDVNISVKDSEGHDLLDTQNLNSYKPDNIKLFYIKNAEKVEVFNAEMDNPKGFFIFKHENEYRIRIFPNTSKNENLPITLIQWNEADTDTIKCNIERKLNSEICRKVWFNNELVWESYKIERFFEIIK